MHCNSKFNTSVFMMSILWLHLAFYALYCRGGGESVILLSVTLLQICHSFLWEFTSLVTELIGTIFRVNFCSAGNCSHRGWHQISWKPVVVLLKIATDCCLFRNSTACAQFLGEKTLAAAEERSLWSPSSQGRSTQPHPINGNWTWGNCSRQWTKAKAGFSAADIFTAGREINKTKDDLELFSESCEVWAMVCICRAGSVPRWRCSWAWSKPRVSGDHRRGCSWTTTEGGSGEKGISGVSFLSLWTKWNELLPQKFLFLPAGWEWCLECLVR